MNDKREPRRERRQQVQHGDVLVPPPPRLVVRVAVGHGQDDAGKSGRGRDDAHGPGGLEAGLRRWLLGLAVLHAVAPPVDLEDPDLPKSNVDGEVGGGDVPSHESDLIEDGVRGGETPEGGEAGDGSEPPSAAGTSLLLARTAPSVLCELKMPLVVLVMVMVMGMTRAVSVPMLQTPILSDEGWGEGYAVGEGVAAVHVLVSNILCCCFGLL
mmetsp:Transcript_2466/g.7208  ORF Transcript_2466/g.7208 Transcript_2466/m.7208 type:complete len:212 (-) Transcript_2466:129-764(-)